MVELEKHPEKFMAGHMWLMGKVAGSIQVRFVQGDYIAALRVQQDIKPARAM
jgi:hypothetical protein